MVREHIDAYLMELCRGVGALDINAIQAVVDEIMRAWRDGCTIFIVGNGGSAALASHMATDLSKITVPGQRRFRVQALTDNQSLMTAWGNDTAYENIFSEQLINACRLGDLLVAISCSGNSPNVVKAARVARDLGARVVAFTGNTACRLHELSDVSVLAPVSFIGMQEDIHVILNHMIASVLVKKLTAVARRASQPAKAFVLAAGEGSRLRPLTLNMPKPMLPIDGKPLLEHTVQWLRRYGIKDIAVNLHHCPDVIVNYFGSGEPLDVELAYSYEDTVLGTAGGVRKMRDFIGDSPLVIVYGDVLTDINLHDLLAFHRQVTTRDSAAAVTLSLYHVSNPTEVGLVDLDSDGRILRFVEKPKREEVFTDLANAGILVVEPWVIDMIPPGIVFDFGRDLFPMLLEKGVSMYGWVAPADTFIMDIGSHAAYDRAQQDWPAHLRVRQTVLQPAIFVDRDGVINCNRPDYVKSWAEFEFLPGAIEALRRLSQLGWPIIVVSNQSVVGRGVVEPQVVDDIHARMVAAIRQAGGRVDDVLYCPHAPQEHCDCRKPQPGLFHQAAERHNIDLSCSYMIGDAACDVEAACAAGCKPVVVRSGRWAEQAAELRAHLLHIQHVAADLLQGADWILDQVAALRAIQADRPVHIAVGIAAPRLHVNGAQVSYTRANHSMPARSSAQAVF